MPEWYTHLPSSVDPIAFSIGFFDIRWYSLLYVVGFAIIWILLAFRVKQKEADFSLDTLWDVVILVFFGSIIGGRLGFFILYQDGGSFLDFFLPKISLTGEWMGWYGMSFFGAFIGAIFSGLVGAWRKKVSFLGIADFVVPAIPLGYFFGRVGNFLNGELIGRETESILGMMVDNVMRHPSQLYEASLEGGVLFIFLWSIRKKSQFPGAMFSLFGLGYGIMRFISEFFRQESEYFLGMTQGQTYALLLIFASVCFYWWQWKKYDRISL